MVKEFQPDLIGISVEVDYHLPRLSELQMELKRLDIHTIPIMVADCRLYAIRTSQKNWG